MATQDNNSAKKPGRLEAAEQAAAQRRADEAAARDQLAAEQAELDAQAAAEQEERERQQGQDLAAEQRERIKDFARRELRKRLEQLKQDKSRKVSDRAQQGGRGKSEDAGRGIRQKGANAARGIRRAGKKAGSQASRKAAQFAARIVAQAARVAAQLAARVATFLVSNPYGWAILIIIVIVILIFIAIVMFSAIFKADSGVGGRPQTNAPTFVIDDHTVRVLKAFAGDLEKRRELIENNTTDILDILDAGQRDIEGSNAPNKAELLAQIEKTRQAVEKLRAAVEKSGQQPTKEKGKLKLPKYVLAARAEALKELDALLKMIKDLAGSLNDRVVAVASDELTKQPTETNGDNIPVYRAGPQAGQLAPYQVNGRTPSERPWCGIFIQWVMRQAGYTNYQGGAGVEYTWVYMKTNHSTFLASEETPRPGDLFFRDDLGHIAIVAEVLDGGQTVRVISGNNSHNTVGYATLSASSARFARMRN